jgi:predicted nucleic acid-binding protein
MAAYFLDTSALIKRHVKETGSTWVRTLVHAKVTHRLYIARITAVEMYAAITRRERNGDLSPAQSGAILGHFRRHLTQRYRVIEMPPALFNTAMLIARKHRLRAYDAVQLTASLEVHRLRNAAGLGPITLISSDQELNAAASAEGLSVDDPNQHP